MTSKIFDAKGVAREQQSRTATTAIGMDAMKPIVHFQVSLLRMWADSMERLARNYERGLKDAANAVKGRDRAA